MIHPLFPSMSAAFAAAAANGATGADLFKAWQYVAANYAGERALALQVQLSHWIEEQAFEGTVWEDCFELLCT